VTHFATFLIRKFICGLPAQRIGSTAADYSRTTDSENRFFCQMAAADRAEGGQVESTRMAGHPSNRKKQHEKSCFSTADVGRFVHKN